MGNFPWAVNPIGQQRRKKKHEEIHLLYIV